MLLVKHLSRYSEDERMTAVLLKEAREKPNIRAGIDNLDDDLNLARMQVGPLASGIPFR